MDDQAFNYDEGFTPEETGRKPYRPVETDLKMDRSSKRYNPAAAEQSPELPPQQPQTPPAPKPKQAPDTPKKQQPQQKPRPELNKKTKEKTQEKKTVQTDEPRAPRSFSIIKFFTDERTRVFLGISLFILSLFVIIAVFSHFHTGEVDQPVVINLPIESAVEQGVLVENATGTFGAWLSYFLLCDALGLGSLVLVVYLWAIALSLLGIRKCNFWSTTFRCLLLAITISVVLGLVMYNSDSTVYWGGNHGHYINKFFFDHTTVIGAILFAVLLVSAVISVYFNELRIVWMKSRDKVVQQREKLQRERERMRQIAIAKINDDNGDYEFELDEDADEEPEAEPAEDKPDKIKPLVSPLTNAVKSLADRLKKKSDGKAENTSDTPPPFVTSDDEEEAVLFDENSLNQAKEDEFDIDVDFTVKSNEIEQADNDDDPPLGSLDTPYDHRADLSSYRFPSIDILEDRPSGPNIDMEEQQANKQRIEETLNHYNIAISKIEATVGPTVTLYEIVPAEGVRIAQIKRLEDDIALSLSAIGIRIIAPIPGKGTVGIEVPNKVPQTVSMRSVINSRKFQDCNMALPMAMGATISNDIFIADLTKMPHLLVAGATGMGKSVGLNAIIASLLYKKHPTELKLVLVDPKMVEFSLYSKLERHYLAKLPNQEDAIITDMRYVVETLNSLCVEMDNRYELLRNANVRSLEEYNKKFTARRLNPEKGHKYLPYIVVVVDEFADLIMTQGKEVETPIARIAQKARAVGIHMILATQRPSTNVITGLIKANFPGRIAFRVIQMVDSRTILDCPGANQLIGRGDMLFSHNGSMERVQCAFISTEEVEALTEQIDDQVGFEHAYYLPEYVPEEAEGGVIAGASTERDSLFDEAARFVVSRQMGSTSSLQRQFGIGYNRAGKLMDQLEAAGVVGPVNGSKPRNILMDLITLDTMLNTQ